MGVYNQNHPTELFRHGNTTGGRLEDEELKAAFELLVAAGDQVYADRINELWPSIEERFIFSAPLAVRAMPYMDDAYAQKLEQLVKDYAGNLERFYELNPFGIPITTGGWAGAGAVVRFALNNYLLHMLHKAFPEIIDKEYVFRGLNYIYGPHPGSNISFVSGVGTKSTMVAHGMNRANYSYIKPEVLCREVLFFLLIFRKTKKIGRFSGEEMNTLLM